MYACICRRVTVDQVETAVHAGADSIESIGHTTTAGTDCSSCHDHLDDILDRCVGCPLVSAVA